MWMVCDVWYQRQWGWHASWWGWWWRWRQPSSWWAPLVASQTAEIWLKPKHPQRGAKLFCRRTLEFHVLYCAAIAYIHLLQSMHDDDCIKQRIPRCLLGVALDPVVNDIMMQETETILSIPANMAMNMWEGNEWQCLFCPPFPPRKINKTKNRALLRRKKQQPIFIVNLMVYGVWSVNFSQFPIKWVSISKKSSCQS